MSVRFDKSKDAALLIESIRMSCAHTGSERSECFRRRRNLIRGEVVAVEHEDWHCVDKVVRPHSMRRDKEYLLIVMGT
jgi:hypothetical protein